MTQRFLLVLVLMIYGSAFGLSQNTGQVLRGKIIDQVSHQPIAYANVVLSDSIVSSTDDLGYYRFENLPIGIYALQVSYIGYDQIYMSNLNVDSGKEAIYNLSMVESAQNLDEVMISASKDKSKPLNEMSLLSTRMVGVEETKKYASAFNDPARMANSFAGVVQTDAGNNTIAIRGNAPNGLLWRLEGVDIPNPNHFSAIGTSGGGVSILSGQLLANSDFSTGAFAAEYGNALSGVFDIKLRKGNNEKREYTFQVGVLGIDAAVEGPFTSGGNNSYLVNYRYSTLGILSKSIDLGGYVTTFQDLSYNLSFKNKKWGDITFFGVNGLSSQTGYDSIYEYDLDFEANTLVNGMTHSKTIGSASFLKSAVVFSKTLNRIKAIETDNSTLERFTSYNESYENKRVTFSTKLQHKISAKTNMKVGVIHNLLWYDAYKTNQDSLNSPFEVFYNEAGSTATSQVYAQILQKFSKRFTGSIGGHIIYNWLNDSYSIEPRLALSYATASNQVLSFGYGLHGQTIPMATHFVEVVKEEGITQPNLDLGMSKAHHFVLGYNFKPSEFLNFKLEAYYQSLFNIPQGLDMNENESLLNYDHGTIDVELSSEGKGRNYGAELTIEKYLNKGYYLTLTGSIYSSKFKGLDGNWYHTRFDGSFASSITGGKEFSISKKKRRTMGIHFKSIFTGGLRHNPIDLEQSILRNETVFDKRNPFSNQFPNYFRFDFKLSFKRNFKRITTSLVFDIQNISNRENVGYEDYNPKTKSVERYSQVGLLPVISYKIEF